MRRSWWLAALLLAPAGAFAQQAASKDPTFQSDLPDNSSAFSKDTSGVSRTPPPSAAPVAKDARPFAVSSGASPGAGDRELIGVVVRAEPRWLWLDYMGAVVPFAVTPQTRFEGTVGAPVAGLAPGQAVRTRFSVVGGQNIATDLQLAPGALNSHETGIGGSGLDPKKPIDPIQPNSDVRNPSLVPSTGSIKGTGNPYP